eukprot:CAMPEP_0174716046 /NCGR_PEP_ID=MMETSP1094-20130205/22753_1 /TAXON_ID=156173 /ORGANISM="Chrysochromulina brevifilum, Strain UTEX LB 985" /LENGTH=136 /DNA_ID=CAMNT_0015915719 /DNA_START=101 /DNA_END=511 /DNA_ORIENTATION=-
MESVRTSMEVVSAKYAQLKTTVAASPVAPVYAGFFGDTTFSVFILDWLPLFLAAIAPLLCLIFVAVGTCGKKGGNVGKRVVRRIGLAIRADLRIVHAAASTMEKGKTLKSVEKGKAEEAKIKGMAKQPAKKPAGKR